MRGLAILFGFNLLGILLQYWLRIPLPANVIGLILFTACLFLNLIKLEWVEESAQFLLRHMMLFFAPIVVGTVALLQIIGRDWAAIVAGLIGGTFIVLAVTGWITNWLSRERSSTNESV
jgi:holin-like protein